MANKRPNTLKPVPMPRVDNPPLVAQPPRIELRCAVQFVARFTAYRDNGDPAFVFKDGDSNETDSIVMSINGGLSASSFAEAREHIVREMAAMEARLNAPPTE